MFKQFFEDLLLGNEEAVENGISKILEIVAVKIDFTRPLPSDSH